MTMQQNEARRPTTLTVFGILNIVFGGLGLMCTPISLLILFFGNMQDPGSRIMRESRLFVTWTAIASPLGFIMAGVLLAAGIGLLSCRNWARLASIVYGIYGIVMGIAGGIITAVTVAAPLLQVHTQGPQAAGAIGGAIGGIAGSCCGLGYPIVLLIFMMRPGVKAACARSVTNAGNSEA
jgi:hypothetical protein